jgi:hypothetical protein
MTNRCDACLDGEHADYDADVRRVSIYEAGMFLRRESLCDHHREALAEDGYDIRAPRPAPAAPAPAGPVGPFCPVCGDANVTDDREPCFACLEAEALDAEAPDGAAGPYDLSR